MAIMPHNRIAKVAKSEAEEALCQPVISCNDDAIGVRRGPGRWTFRPRAAALLYVMNGFSQSKWHGSQGALTAKETMKANVAKNCLISDYDVFGVRIWVGH